MATDGGSGMNGAIMGKLAKDTKTHVTEEVKQLKEELQKLNEKFDERFDRLEELVKAKQN